MNYTATAKPLDVNFVTQLWKTLHKIGFFWQAPNYTTFFHLFAPFTILNNKKHLMFDMMEDLGIPIKAFTTSKVCNVMYTCKC
jgi:hypothetical protein